MKISKHYFDRYDKFISHYKNIICEGFVERHHIVPVCLGGGNELQNLVALPPRAHFIAHALLHKAYPEHRGLAHAFAMMIVNNPHQKRTIGSKLYAMAKQARSNALIGIPRSEEVKAKLRKPKSITENYKKPKSKEHAKNISKALKGKAKSPESIQKMVNSNSKHYQKRKSDHNKKKEMFQKLFSESTMSKKEFSEYHGMNYSTIKKYLKSD